jgi:hypothetical protein
MAFQNKKAFWNNIILLAILQNIQQNVSIMKRRNIRLQTNL